MALLLNPTTQSLTMLQRQKSVPRGGPGCRGDAGGDKTVQASLSRDSEQQPRESAESKVMLGQTARKEPHRKVELRKRRDRHRGLVLSERRAKTDASGVDPEYEGAGTARHSGTGEGLPGPPCGDLVPDPTVPPRATLGRGVSVDPARRDDRVEDLPRRSLTNKKIIDGVTPEKGSLAPTVGGAG